ncbi:MAG: undecaprenyl-diphosphatase UppP [Pyrinomonadaceae bacterium]|nr:undecaprenyl-diphosphatase UppP [Pyrinomonadaceae bacterium]
MSILQAIILGIVQGLTEFIPISSTAHLVLASRATGLGETLNSEQTTAVIAVIQLGTLLAVLIYFARDILKITRAFIVDHLALLRGGKSEAALEMTMMGQKQSRLSDDAWLGWLIIIGSIPIATIGLLLKKIIEGPFTKNLYVIATMMILVAIGLGVAEFVSRRMARRRNITELGIKDALAVGGAQCLALIPGASRSGSTIMAGLFVGEARETAARFSFLLSIPAIAASGLLELKEAKDKLPGGSFVPLAVATIVSGIVGYLSIWFLLRFLRTHTTGIFIGYRIIVGLLIFGLVFAGMVSPYYGTDAPPEQKGTTAPAAAQPSPEQKTEEPLPGANPGTNNNPEDSVNFNRPSRRARRSSDKRKGGR